MMCICGFIPAAGEGAATEAEPGMKEKAGRVEGRG